jgi:predicted nucleic acid-binding protein
MTVVCDMGPLQYLILIGCDHILSDLYDRVLTPTVVVEKEMSDPRTPAPVRAWAQSPPDWLEVRDPTQVLHIPTLGTTGVRGDGDRAAISLAIEVQADYVLMDDTKARKQVVVKAKEYGLKMQPVWMLEVLAEAAERGLVADLEQKLEHLEQRTPFYVGNQARQVLDAMLRRDHERKQTQKLEQMSKDQAGETHEPTQEKKG